MCLIFPNQAYQSKKLLRFASSNHDEFSGIGVLDRRRAERSGISRSALLLNSLFTICALVIRGTMKSKKGEGSVFYIVSFNQSSSGYQYLGRRRVRFNSPAPTSWWRLRFTGIIARYNFKLPKATRKGEKSKLRFWTRDLSHKRPRTGQLS